MQCNVRPRKMQLQLVKRSETQQDNKIKEWMKVRYNEGWRIGLIPYQRPMGVF